MFEVIGKPIPMPCFGTSIQFGCIFQSSVQICSHFLVILLSFIPLPMQVCISVCLTKFILERRQDNSETLPPMLCVPQEYTHIHPTLLVKSRYGFLLVIFL